MGRATTSMQIRPLAAAFQSIVTTRSKTLFAGSSASSSGYLMGPGNHEVSIHLPPPNNGLKLTAARWRAARAAAA
jgi:hypothetical protein